MPIDDFDLSSDMAVDPLDVSGMGGTPPFVQQQQARPNFKDFAPLLAMLPMAARGGQGNVAALLHGYQQARARKQQQGRVTAQDERLASRDDLAAQKVQADKTNQQRTQQRQFMDQFSGALGGVDNPDAVKALIDFYGPQAQAFGMEQPALEQFAMQTATPDKLLTRKVSKRWDKMSASEKEMAQRTQASLQIDGTVIPFHAWSPLVGGMVDPATGAYPQAPAEPPKPETRSLDVQAADALAKGDTATYQRLRKVADEMSSARQNPPIQVTVGGSGLTTQQVTAASGLRDDFRTESKDFYAARDGYERLLSAGADPSPAGDLALLYGFMKLLDPNSVVRETEFAQAARAGSLPQRVQAWATRVISGERLTPAQRADFMNQAKGLFGRAQNRQTSRQEKYRKISRGSGIPEDLVIADDPPVDEGALAPPPDASAPEPTQKLKVGRFDVEVSD